MPKNKRFVQVLILVLIICIYFIITLIATYPAALNNKNLLYGNIYGTDNRVSLWHFWWQKYAFIHKLNENFISIIAAPFGVDQSGASLPLLWMSITRGVSILTNEIFTYNFLLFVSFVLSALTMYALAYFCIRERKSAFIAGLIYGFCPYHFNKAWEHFLLAQIQWLPFFILSLLLLYKKFNIKNIILYLIAFILTVNFDFTYILVSLIATLGFFVFTSVYRIFKKQDKFFMTLKSQTAFLLKLSGVSLFGLILNAPLVISVVQNLFMLAGPTTSAVHVAARPFSYLFAQSARPLSYLLPAVSHPFFGGFTRKMFGSLFYGRGSIEQTLYLGWVPFVLVFAAFRQWKQKRRTPLLNPGYRSSEENFYIGFFIFSAWLAFMCSMPPWINLGLFKVYFPSFFLYKILPMFRAYARFGVFVMLCVSVLAGYGLKYVLGRITNRFLKLLFTAIVFLAILFEFNNIPPWRFTDLTKAPEVYSWLKTQEGDFIIVDYPMILGSPGEAQINYDSLFYQTIHQKKIFNGAVPGSGGFEIKKKIMKVTDPITPGILKALGVRYVIFHSDSYAKDSLPDSVDVIGEIPQMDKDGSYRLIKHFGNDFVYEINAQPVDLNDILKK